MERRLAAILAADVAGYSRLTELSEEASTATVRELCAAAEEIIEEHRGKVFTRAGDGIVAEFPSVVEAVRCAVDIQNEIKNRNVGVPEGGRMQFRIGVNLGDVVYEEKDVYGTGVNVAARLEQLAEPGGIYISQVVYDQVRKVIELPFDYVGLHRLKNITQPVHLYQIHPVPLPWFRKILSPKYIRTHLGTALGVPLLLLVAAVSLYYQREPLINFNTLISDFGDVISSPLPEQASIAVLPFDDLSPGGDQDYLADGITEELTTGLAKFPRLLVVARASTLPYKDQPTDIRKIGKELNVRYLLQGSIQRADQNIRVTAQLIDGNTGSHFWAERFDRKLNNIFEIRDEITDAIAGTLGGMQGKVAKAEILRLASKAPKNLTAYEYVVKGWREFHEFTQKHNETARNLFEKAIDADPTYARAYAGLAWTYASDYDFEYTDDFDGALEKALANARTAVSLDENDYQAHWALGWAYLYSRQFDRAMASYLRAQELNPHDTEVLAEMANPLIYTGEAQKAVAQLKQAIKLNPHHENWYLEFLGWAYEEAGEPLKAIEILEKVIDLEDPGEEKLWVMPSFAAAYAAVGKEAESRKVVESLLELQPDFSIAEHVSLLPYETKELADRYADALRRAGLPEKALAQGAP